MEKEDLVSRLKISHVRGQVISYFVFSLLFMYSASVVDPSKPIVDFKWVGYTPQLDFNFPKALPISLAVICLAISLLFIAIMFLITRHYQIGWVDNIVAFSLSRRSSFIFSIMLIASFIVSWLSGLNRIVGLPRPWQDIFFWFGVIIFSSLSLHFIISAGKVSKERENITLFYRVRSTLKKLIPKRKSCLDCGYLMFPVATDRTFIERELAPPRQVRERWKNGELLEGTKNAVCYRRKWDNSTLNGYDAGKANVLRGRYCSTFYSYSGGSPAEHVESHRARTQRRWVVAGALIGPYLATGVGFIASQAAAEGGNPIGTLKLAFLGLFGLLVAVLVINLGFNRT